ncbi:MAG: hypothetical protein M1816_006067 [Peltula sp. TS41687]|nr:MAG: hypothetical protein M1816_006067 [Peltula sp. TS41687]
MRHPPKNLLFRRHDKSLKDLHITRRRISTATTPSCNNTWSQQAIPPQNVAVDEVAKLAAGPLHPFTLADLVRHGRPPLSVDALLSSANFTLSLLPIRLAHRLQALRNLPYIVVSNPHISRIYGNYLHSLSSLLPYTERRISSLQEESAFTEVLADLVHTHLNTIPVLAKGFLECRKYISPSEVTTFLDEHLRARIGTRLIAEQHIAFHSSSRHQHLPQDGQGGPRFSGTKYQPAPGSCNYIGVIDTALKPASVVHSCGSFVSEICDLKYGVRPSLVINGQPETTFAFVPVHLEYIITELLKNAFRAVVESGMEKEPVVITIAAAPDDSMEDDNKSVSQEAPQNHQLGQAEAEASSSSSSNAESLLLPPPESAPGVTIRIRDRGGGISLENLPKIWSYSFTTFTDNEFPGTGYNANAGTTTIDALNAISSTSMGNSSSIAGLGYGLPLSRAYAEYFGGKIAVQSMWGWGTDVYLRLKGVGSGRVA